MKKPPSAASRGYRAAASAFPRGPGGAPPNRGGEPSSGRRSHPEGKAGVARAGTTRAGATKDGGARSAGAKAGGSYWLYGRHAVEAALANPARRARRLYATPGALESLSTFLGAASRPGLAQSLEIRRVDGGQLQKLLGSEAVHQGMALEVAPLEDIAIEDILAQPAESSLLLVLDQVTDPHNIGAILRSAAAFGAAAVILARDHAPGETAVMAKAACGAMELVPRVAVTNLARALEAIKQAGYWVVGLDGSAAQALHAHKLRGRIALVLGAEGKGMRRLTLEHCDLLARLPIAPRMESLNVSNAAAVALYELSRDRLDEPGRDREG